MHDDLTNQCQRLYDAKAAQMILYGRALGLSHAEAEDVLQETFLAVMRLESVPVLFDHYCMRVFRNRALNYHRGLFRRLARELESRHWFEPAGADAREETAVRQLAELPAEQREVIVLKIWQEITFEEIGALVASPPTPRRPVIVMVCRNSAVFLIERLMKTIRRIGKRTSDLDAPPPSARLRARVFGRPAAEPGWGWSQARLAFASAVGLALLMAIRLNPPAMPAGGEGRSAMLAAALSNQTLAAYAVPQANQEWNVPAASFDFTNMGLSPGLSKPNR